MPRYHRLRPELKVIFNVLVVAHEAIHPNRLCDVLCRLFPEFQLSETAIKKSVATLTKRGFIEATDAGLCVLPTLEEVACRAMAKDGMYERIAAIYSEDADPLPHARWLVEAKHAPLIKRELHRALYAGNLEACLELQSLCRGQIFGLENPPDIVDLVTKPLESKLILGLPAAFSERIVGQILAVQDRDMLRFEGLRALIVALHKKTFKQASTWTDQFLAELALRDGELDKADALAADFDHWPAFVIRARVCLAKGNLSAACKYFGMAALEHRRENGGGELFGFSAVLQPLSYLLQGTKARVRQAKSLIEEFFLGLVVKNDSYYAALPLLYRMQDEQKAEITEIELADFEHPLAVLVEALLAYWDDCPLPRERLEKAQTRAAFGGDRWLAGELMALLECNPDCAMPGAVALMTHRQPMAAWMTRLEAVEQALGLSKSTASNASEGHPRIVWLVGVYEQEVHVQAREQKPKGRSAWTKGRKIGDARLVDEAESITSMTEHDLRIASSIVRRAYRGWGGVEYRCLPQVWSALIDHPRLFDISDPSRAIVVKGERPHLSVERTDNGVVLNIVPGLPKQGGFLIKKLAADRYEVTSFTTEQLRLATLLKGGLRVPQIAMERMSALLGELASEFDVHDNAQMATAAATEQDPELPLVIIVRRSGDGLRLRLAVMPLGDKGPSFAPGIGAESVLARINDKPVCTRREIGDEQSREKLVFDLVPRLQTAPIEGAEYLFEAPEDALELLLELKQLGDSVRLMWPDGEVLKVRGAGRIGAKSLAISVGSSGDWFSASGKLVVDEDLTLDLMNVLELIESSPSSSRFVRLEDGGFLALSDALRRRLDNLSRISKRGNRKNEDALSFHKLAASVVGSLVEEAGEGKSSAGFKKQLRLINQVDVTDSTVPKTLQAELRSYQVDGFTWMTRITRIGAGACLADDMGLGKTVQSLAFLLHRASEGPSLVIAPTSVCGVWREEAWRFAPSLNVRRFGDGDRAAMLKDLGPNDLVVCSYGLLQSEIEQLGAVQWSTLVLDEAQAIKNPNTRRHQAALALKAEVRLATTGTPIENHLGELWALFAFLNPGLLGTWSWFRKRFAQPIEEGNRTVTSQLRQLITPFILRRTKSNVLEDLPARTDITLSIEPSAEEAVFYEALRRRAAEQLKSTKGSARPMQILAELTRLRLAACNPALLDASGLAPESSKLKAFGELVENLVANGHRALVFSQFIKHLALLRKWLDANGVSYCYLDGGTPAKERDRLVKAFQAGEGELFLISLRAGGFGLNLTAADYVVHMDPWWNPAVEDQASDRVHRIGQTRPVTVYRLVSKGTIEEKIVDLHKSKRRLADQLLADSDTAGRLSTEQLMALIDV